jgi:16S rRNA (uracil1498-N3)-methyltransferase
MADRFSVSAHVVVHDIEAPALDSEDVHHLSSVLRLRSGEAVGATDGRGAWRPCRFQADGSLQPDGDVVREIRPGPPLTIAFAPVKGDRPEWAVQKLTEVGVDRIILMHTDRSVVRWDGSRAASHLARLRKVARQALMQSRGCWLPDISGVVPFSELAGCPGTARASRVGVPPSLALPTVLIGPEGGWSPSEAGHVAPAMALGPGVMRSETAAVAAGVLLAALRSELVASASPAGPAAPAARAATAAAPPRADQ